MVQSIFDTQDEERRDDPWLSEFSAIDPSVAPDRVQAQAEPEPEPIIELPPAVAQPPKYYDPYADEEPFDGYETVVSEPWLPEPAPAPPVVETPFAPLPYETESPAETARRSGMAWSLGIMFFSSVAFMLLLGWGADLILGTSPWGLVAGIVLGSLIGFVQFFRTSSKLFPGRQPVTEVKPLISPPDDETDLGGPF
jgi:hypothetical protein